MRPDAPSETPADGIRPSRTTPPPPRPAEMSSSTRPRSRRAARTASILAALGYLCVAMAISLPLWADLDNRSPAEGSGDHTQFEWMLAHGARVLAHGDVPFFTALLNTPDGVNLMANTSALGLSLPMTPVTLLWGPQVSYAVMLVLGLAGTAYGWFWFFSCRVNAPAWALVLAGAFCGFAPGMLAHTEGHLNWTSQMLVPFVVDRLFRLGEVGRTFRNSLVLAALVIYQFFIAEEVLFFIGLGVSIFGLCYATTKWRDIRPDIWRMASALGIAAAAVLVVLAYPLWFQFLGPQSYGGTPLGGTRMSTDLLALVSYSGKSLAGSAEVAATLAPNAAEQNSFLGWPLAAAAVAAAAWLWRDAVARAVAITAVLFAVLSLGTKIVVGGRATGLTGPWAAMRDLPLFDAVVPARLALIMVPCIATLLLLTIMRVRAAAARTGRAGSLIRTVGLLALVAVLAPLLPLPMRTVQRDPLPNFITLGLWEPYLSDGGSMMVVATRPLNTTGMRWAAHSGLNFAISGGYFLAPGGPDGRAMYGSRLRPTSRLISDVTRVREGRDVTAAEQRAARDDLRHWNVSLVVLPNPDDALYTELVSGLLGDGGTVVGGVRLWDVRRITSR